MNHSTRLVTTTIALTMVACGPLDDRFVDVTLQPAATRATSAEAGCAFTPQHDLFGVNVWVFDTSYVPDLVDLGARWIRLECCKDQGDRSHAFYSQAIDQVHGAGSKVLLLVDGMVAAGQPHWFDGDDLWNPYRERYLAELEYIARALGPRVDAWEIWNEPDHQLDPAYGYDPGIPANQFGLMLRDAAQVIRRYSNGHLVIGGLATNRFDYLVAARNAAGGTLDYDGIGVHTYAPPDWNMDQVRYELDTRFASWRNVMPLPIWVTEAGGLVTSTGNEGHAAEYVQTLFQHIQANHGEVHTVTYFTHHDTSTLVERNEAFGLVRVDNSRRPAFGTFSALSPDYSGGVCSGPGGPVVEAKAVRARRVDQPLTIDGDLGDWNLDSGIRLTAANYVRLAASSSGDADLSARVSFAWDQANLYLAASVIDDVHVGNQSATDMWQVDSIQIAIDPARDRNAGAYAGDDSEFGLALLSSGPAATAWVTPAGAAGFSAQVQAWQPSSSEWIVEAAIPLAALGLLAPATGRTIGLSALVNDDDGGGREGWVEWTPGIGLGKDPSAFGDLVLGGGVGEIATACAGSGECAEFNPPTACGGAWSCNAAHRCEWLCARPDAGTAPVVDAGTVVVDAAPLASFDAGAPGDAAPANDSATTPTDDAGNPVGFDASVPYEASSADRWLIVTDAGPSRTPDAARRGGSRQPADYEVTTSCGCHSSEQSAVGAPLLLLAAASAARRRRQRDRE